MSKKAMFTQEHLQSFAVALVVMFILLWFVGSWKTVASETSVTEQCRTSVLRNARYHIAGLEIGSEIDCPTRTIELTDETEEQARKEVADGLYTCWKQFGQGELNMFSGNGVYCNVCFIVDVNTEKPITNLGNYLMTTSSPTEQMTYYDYLSNFKTPKAAEILKNVNDGLQKGKVNPDDIRFAGNSLEPDKKYAIIFVYAKGDEKFLKIFDQKMVDQVLAKNDAGKIITGVAVTSGVAAGASVAIIAATAPVSVPVIVVVGGVAVATVGVFTGVEAVGAFFNPDQQYEWLAFNVLREWNPENTPDILKNELGCTELVETENN